MRCILTVLAGTFFVDAVCTCGAGGQRHGLRRGFMFGRQGDGKGGGAGCPNYLNAYFSISVFKGAMFKAGDTMSERGNFLDECSTSSSSERSSVKSQFVQLEVLP